MTRFRSCLDACLSFAAVATPIGIASSTAGLAQTVESAQTALPSGNQPIDTSDPLPVDAAPAVDPRQVECVAKIILHEAANEPRAGRVAVAQVIRARTRDRRFAPDACAVAKQRGQFFDVDAYNPSRGTDRWQDAVAIAHETLSGTGDELAPGALFFHAARSPMPGRQRVAQIGGHVFYR